MMIKTGIPGKDEYIEFTSSLLPEKSKGKSFAKYPFFSDTHAYPKLKLKNSTYEDILEFFFNKEEFTKIIRNKTQKNLPKVSRQKIKIDNFELTLRLLFPTTYPLVGNIDNSVEYIIPTKKIFTMKGSDVFSILPIRFQRKYSYLNIDSTTYTITKTVWNNDVMNHPVYSQFIQSYREFDNWKSDPSLNVFQDKKSFQDNMDIILSYVFDAVQKSEEDPLFKKMYDDPTKAPYYSSSSSKRLDENTLAIQNFDNTIDELIRKDETALSADIIQYENDYGRLYIDLSNNLSLAISTTIPTTTPTTPTTPATLATLAISTFSSKLLDDIKSKHDSVGNVTTKDYDTFKSVIDKNIDDLKSIDKTKKTQISEKVNEIISILKLLQKNKQDKSNLKLKKTNTTSDYYKYLIKHHDEKVIKEKKEEFLHGEGKDYKYKSNLINLLGKLAAVKKENYQNVSPDLLNLIDYLKTNVTDFNIKRRVSTFINDLNIKFLSNPDYKTELEKIQSLYVEFYNLALVIDGLKGRKIDNQIWRDAIFKMMNGTLEENYFNNKIWEPLQDCYHLEDDNPDSNKKKSGKKCDPDVITVGLDIIPSSSKEDANTNANTNTNTNANAKPNAKGVRKTTIPTIEVYLQMDMIEGKIDDTNVNKIKCSYEDAFLGSMFHDLINTGKQINTFPSEQVYFSANKLLVDTASPTTTTTTTPAKVGGKTRKHKLKMKKRRRYTKKNK